MPSRCNNLAPRQSAGDQICLVECVTKLVLFITVTVIILYIPLGRFHLSCDPECCSRNNDPPPPKEKHSTAMCCLCDMYKRVAQVGQMSMEMVELILCTTVNMMYEVKMKFYQMLTMLDRRDLCRSVCCKGDTPNSNVKPEKLSECCKEEKVTCKCGKQEKVICKCDEKEKVICKCDEEKKVKDKDKVICECSNEEPCPC